jgi:WD40-like Beta Propeller Repeat
MDRANRAVRAGWVVGLVSLVLVTAAAPARAAFPGRNGLLVVQPASGKGLIVVGADGANPRQICGAGTQCNEAGDPMWSPDGSEIAFASSRATNDTVGGPQPYVIYPDGSCSACPVPAPPGNFYVDSWDPDFGPGFLPDGRLAVKIDEVDTPQVGAVNTDGIGFQPFMISGSWQQPAWSPSGQLAAVGLVRHKPEVFVIDPVTGAARQLTRDGASSPNWSPDGRRLAMVHRSWIELIGSGGGAVRRLIRGRAPAWAPDDKKLAFVGAHDRLYVIAASGGRPRPVGHIHGQRVDWQPVTGQSPSPCQAPTGSSVLAASPDATVTSDPGPLSQNLMQSNGGFSVLGCLTSDGRERLLESIASPIQSYGGVGDVREVTIVGDYAALVNHYLDTHYGNSGAAVAVFDLRTGTAVADRGGESAGGPGSGVDQLVLGADAVTAAHTFGINCNLGSSCPTVEQIVANDSTGTHILDSITDTGPNKFLLTQLALSGDTLTWSHAGTPESAELN